MRNLYFVSVYKSEKDKLVIFQLRSGVAKRKEKDFISDLIAWCKESGIANVVHLSSVSADERVDNQIIGSPLRYLTTAKDKTAFE